MNPIRLDFAARADRCNRRSDGRVQFIDECSALPLLIDVHDVATLLTVSTRTIYRLVEAGDLPEPLHIGRLARWRAVDVVAFVELLNEPAEHSPPGLPDWEPSLATWPTTATDDREQPPN